MEKTKTDLLTISNVPNLFTPDECKKIIGYSLKVQQMEKQFPDEDKEFVESDDGDVEEIEDGLVDKISFNANLFRDILLANKECTSAVLEVSNDGLARINFKIDDYDSTYYIVATQGVD